MAGTGQIDSIHYHRHVIDRDKLKADLTFWNENNFEPNTPLAIHLVDLIDDEDFLDISGVRNIDKPTLDNAISLLTRIEKTIRVFFM